MSENCNDFKCKYVHQLSKDEYFCIMHSAIVSCIDCQCCFFHTCNYCSSSSGSCADAAYKYFSEVVLNGQKS